YVFNKMPKANIKFQWVGKISKSNRLIYEEDIRKLHLTGKVEFTGATASPQTYYSNFDVFLMTSKEDPFPLVCIEVGMLGKPIICFKEATGTEEVLSQVEGAVVPYLDIEQMGEKVLRYYKNEKELEKDSLKMKMIFNEFTVENQSKKIVNMIKNTVS